jgi:hypothetical protein
MDWTTGELNLDLTMVSDNVVLGTRGEWVDGDCRSRKNTVRYQESEVV